MNTSAKPTLFLAATDFIFSVYIASRSFSDLPFGRFTSPVFSKAIGETRTIFGPTPDLLYFRVFVLLTNSSSFSPNSSTPALPANDSLAPKKNRIALAPEWARWTSGEPKFNERSRNSTSSPGKQRFRTANSLSGCIWWSIVSQ